MEQQMRLVGDEITIPPIQVKLDRLDREILTIFLEHPTWHLKVHQIRTILKYNKLEAGYIKISRRLEFLTATTLLSRYRGSKVYLYYLTPSN